MTQVSRLMMKASGAALLLAMAAGMAQARTQTAAAPGETAANNTVVVVTGVRASMRSSAQIKKNTQEIVDSITAEDIGKLPDNNVAETLTRIPGVQGYRYGGEGASPVGQGSGLTIRGLSGQTASQVDGRSYATAGLREFNIEDAIPSMIAGADVYKNPSAEHIEGGIGGLINLRTRHPSDFKTMTFTVGATARYNDLENTIKPEIFGMFANRWDLPGGGRVGLVIGATYQKSEGRSDNNPGNGGATYRRMIKATDPEYATLAAANTANDPSQPLSTYVGRPDVTFLANVPTQGCNNITTPCNMPNTSGLTAAQAANIVSDPAETHNVAEEVIKRTRKGFGAAADWVVNDRLRLYAETNYTYYLYNQNYMFLNPNDGRNVQNLTLAPFDLTQGLANRNLGGGANSAITTQRVAGGTFLNSDVSVRGGDEHHPYWTAIAAGGFEWQASPRLQFKGDLALTKSRVDDDNRHVDITSAPGVWTGAVANQGWAITRVLSGTPQTLTISGPDLRSAANWVYSNYGEDAKFTQQDSSRALRFDARYTIDHAFVTDIKAGVRWSHTQDLYQDYRDTGTYWLTTTGSALISSYAAGYHGNGIAATSAADLLTNSIGNFMRGSAGYSGGYLVYDPLLLPGNRVGTRFPLAAIPANDPRAENLALRRFESEDTSAIYAMADFAGFDDKIKGNVGVRLVRTDQFARAKVADFTTPGLLDDRTDKRSYTDALPSLNLTYYADPDFLFRFGYSKALTRQGFSDLNPSLSLNTSNGTGSRGAPDLKPLRADNYDVSVERYFTKDSYASFDVFYKKLDGFVYGVFDCEAVPGAPAPLQANTTCPDPSAPYQITHNVNALGGYAKGVELAGQTFFDVLPGIWKHFGAIGSFSYLDARNNVDFGNALQGHRILQVPLPFQSRYNYSVQGLYDDGRLSARLVYTWRSKQVLFGVSTNPIDGRYIGDYGILDMSVNYKLNDNLSLTFNGNNLTDKGLDRFVGEPGYATGIERQHYLNGRTYSLGFRYKFGG